MGLEHHCGSVHAACDLVDYIFPRVAIAYKPAFVNMATNENDLGHYERIAGDFAFLIDSVELQVSEGSDCDEPDSVSFLEFFFKICANQGMRPIKKRHRCP